MAAILSARWIVSVTGRPIFDGAVVVANDRIAAVGSREVILNTYPDTEIIDFGNAAILPGFVNVHSHLDLTGFRGRLEMNHFFTWISSLIRLKRESLNADDLLNSARLGCIEAIRAGITTLGDTSDSSASLTALCEAGLMGVVYQECFGPDAGQRDASLDVLKAQVESNRQLVSALRAEDRVKVGVSPHAPYSVSAELFAAVTKYALDESLDVAIHAAESREERDLLSTGSGPFAESLRTRGIDFQVPQTSTIEYFHQLGVLGSSPLLIHCVTADRRDLERIANSGSRVAHCPKSNAKFGHGVARLGTMIEKGVIVGLGSDSVASNNSMDLIEEARFCGLLHRGVMGDGSFMSAHELLELATINGARALRLEDEIGSIEAGKRADLIAIDLNGAHNAPCFDVETAIAFSSRAGDIVFAMGGGKTLYRYGKVTALDEATVVQAIERLQEKLMVNE